MFHTAPPAIACWDRSGWLWLVLTGLALEYMVPAGTDIVAVVRRGCGGVVRRRCWVEVAGFGYAATALGFDLLGPGDAEPVAGAAAGGEFAGLDPVVDDADAAAEPFGGVGDADLAVGVGRRGGDVVGVADPLDGLDVERAPVPVVSPAALSMPGQLGGVGGGSEPGHHLDRRRGAAFGGSGVNGARHRAVRRLRRCASGSRSAPCAWSGSGSRVMSAIRVRSSRLRSLLLVVGACQSPGRSAASFSSSARVGSGGSVSRAASRACFGLGEGGEFGLPPGFQVAGHQPVFRLDRVEGAFGAVGLVAGAFDGEFGGPADPPMPVGDLVGGGQRQRDLGGVQRRQQSGSATASSTVAATTDRQVGVVSRSARREHS